MAMTTTDPAAAEPPLAADATCDFLRRHAPFNRMREDALRALVPQLKLAYFAKDATILSTQSGPVADLHIVQRGLVGSRPDNTQADPDRTLGPGELFPVGALSAGGTTTKIFHALQDTVCYLLPRERLPRAAARVAGVRALLHAGDHRDAASSRWKASTASTASARPSSRR